MAMRVAMTAAAAKLTAKLYFIYIQEKVGENYHILRNYYYIFLKEPHLTHTIAS